MAEQPIAAGVEVSEEAWFENVLDTFDLAPVPGQPGVYAKESEVRKMNKNPRMAEFIAQTQEGVRYQVVPGVGLRAVELNRKVRGGKQPRWEKIVDRILPLSTDIHSFRKSVRPNPKKGRFGKAYIDTATGEPLQTRAGQRLIKFDGKVNAILEPELFFTEKKTSYRSPWVNADDTKFKGVLPPTSRYSKGGLSVAIRMPPLGAEESPTDLTGDTMTKAELDRLINSASKSVQDAVANYRKKNPKASLEDIGDVALELRASSGAEGDWPIPGAETPSPETYEGRPSSEEAERQLPSQSGDPGREALTRAEIGPRLTPLDLLTRAPQPLPADPEFGGSIYENPGIDPYAAQVSLGGIPEIPSATQPTQPTQPTQLAQPAQSGVPERGSAEWRKASPEQRAAWIAADDAQARVASSVAPAPGRSPSTDPSTARRAMAAAAAQKPLDIGSTMNNPFSFRTPQQRRNLIRAVHDDERQRMADFEREHGTLSQRVKARRRGLEQRRADDAEFAAQQRAANEYTSATGKPLGRVIRDRQGRIVGHTTSAAGRKFLGDEYADPTLSLGSKTHPTDVLHAQEDLARARELGLDLGDFSATQRLADAGTAAKVDARNLLFRQRMMNAPQVRRNVIELPEERAARLEADRVAAVGETIASRPGATQGLAMPSTPKVPSRTHPVTRVPWSANVDPFARGGTTTSSVSPGAIPKSTLQETMQAGGSPVSAPTPSTAEQLDDPHHRTDPFRSIPGQPDTYPRVVPTDPRLSYGVHTPDLRIQPKLPPAGELPVGLPLATTVDPGKPASKRSLKALENLQKVIEQRKKLGLPIR